MGGGEKETRAQPERGESAQEREQGYRHEKEGKKSQQKKVEVLLLIMNTL